jgi:uncharacterized protein
MALYALGDLHLGTAVDKPMNVFGEQWTDHPRRIAEKWTLKVTDEDTVLIPGDISWAMTLDEAKPDLTWIGQLPGQKILIRGNHDYWWSGIGKVRGILPAGTFALQNDSILIDGISIAGTRGWLLPSHPNFTEDDQHILDREVHRLRLSLESAAQSGENGSGRIVCMLHYPPLAPDGDETVFTKVLEEFDVELCLYGHLHGAAHRFAVNEEIRGVRYQLVSCDYLEFDPMRIES